MKLACFTMMRNESAILDAFLDQIGEFFDYAVILDHASTDGSANIVRARGDARIQLCRLQAHGYPQSEVATFFARRLFEREMPDFVFFLDCDEFLPFADRAELEAFLADKQNYDFLRLKWLNLAPASFEGGNIFEQPLRAPSASETRKVILSSSLVQRWPQWLVRQGYHGVNVSQMDGLRILDVEDHCLLHFPVQSRSQFMFKLAAGSTRLLREQTNLKMKRGSHWVDLAKEALLRPLSEMELREVALGYPKRLHGADSAEKLNFDFPYLRSAYRESASYFGGQVQGLMRVMEEAPMPFSHAYSIMNEAGEIIATSKVEQPPLPAELDRIRSDKGRSLPAELFAATQPAEVYAALVEPLFNLPAKLPVSSWSGHIPFLFTLFRAMRPKTYVELGVQNGAGLIAASTAASTYNLPTYLSGVDPWQGENLAKRQESDQLYQDLRTYLSVTFPNVHLERGQFSEAVQRFHPGSIDILRINGLHTYDAVKEDFTTWFDRVSPTGIIVLQGISVFEHGFGVHRLWAEIKEKFTILEFHHSTGLGILVLDPSHPGLAPVLSLARNPTAWRLYQSLVADIANTVPQRMEAFQNAQPTVLQHQLDEERRQARRAQKELASVYSSTSWRLTSPVRAFKRILGSR